MAAPGTDEGLPPPEGSQDVVDVVVRRLDDGAALPTYAHPGDAGADLATTVDVTIGPGERVLVPTGIAIALPTGYAAFVHPRSGLALRHGLGIVNAPGTIDAGYRGEVSVLLVNHDRQLPVTLHRGDRIAQLVVQRVSAARFQEADLLPASARGEGGYGSTGGHADGAVTGPADTDHIGNDTDHIGIDDGQGDDQGVSTPP